MAAVAIAAEAAFAVAASFVVDFDTLVVVAAADTSVVAAVDTLAVVVAVDTLAVVVAVETPAAVVASEAPVGTSVELVAVFVDHFHLQVAWRWLTQWELKPHLHHLVYAHPLQ